MKNFLMRNCDGADFFDEFADLFRPVVYGEKDCMKTDIKENENDYTLDIEMPGFDKTDINLSLSKGYLTVSAEKVEKDEDKKGKYLRRERSVKCERSYYVGDGVTEENVQAKYENGVLNVTVPKELPKEPEVKKIAVI